MAGKGGYNASEPRDYHGRWAGDGGGQNRGTSADATHPNVEDAAKSGAEAQGPVHPNVSKRGLPDDAATAQAAAMERAGKPAAGDGASRYKTPINGNYGTKYNPASVNKAINNASRYQGKVSSGERSAIHRLLKGRH